jgi:hypothetical protein
MRCELKSISTRRVSLAVTANKPINPIPAQKIAFTCEENTEYEDEDEFEYDWGTIRSGEGRGRERDSSVRPQSGRRGDLIEQATRYPPASDGASPYHNVLRRSLFLASLGWAISLWFLTGPVVGSGFLL